MTTTVSRSEFLRGQATAMAIAADAPQMPTAPPESTPNRPSSFRALASNQPKPIVSGTATNTINAVDQPKSPTWLNVMRNPNSATLTRSSVRADTLMPGV